MNTNTVANTNTAKETGLAAIYAAKQAKTKAAKAAKTTSSRSNRSSKSTANLSVVTVTKPPIDNKPITELTQDKLMTISTEQLTDTYTDIDGIVDSDKMLNDLLAVKYGEVPLCITKEDVYRLANSKTIPYPTVVMLYILMHYGKEFVMNDPNSVIFEEEGAIAKFALKYGLEADQVGRAISKIVTANSKWESISMPTQMLIPFEFDEKGKTK